MQALRDSARRAARRRSPAESHQPDGLSIDPVAEAAMVFAGARVVIQPIVSVADGSMLAVEALTRFRDTSGTEQVFIDAHRAGYGTALEASCLRAAMALRSTLPDDVMLTVNISPNVLRSTTAEFWPDDMVGVIVEITEQGADDSAATAEAVGLLRSRGAAIAVDDVGTGYAGLLRLAELRPEYVKVARDVVSGVQHSPAKAAVLESLVTLSHRLGAAVIAEGVEFLGDLAGLSQLDVDYVQGYAIARPAPELAPVDAKVIAACRAGRQGLLSASASFGHAAGRTRDVYRMTAALAAADDPGDVVKAIAQAATELAVDVIGVSVIGRAEMREVACWGASVDPITYPLADYPATLTAIEAGHVMEAHAEDPHTDPAERAVMRRLGQASLLLIPMYVDGVAVGILELAHRHRRRWSAQDIAHARGLAEHLGPVLERLRAAGHRLI